ncbi:hypothetical protein PI124_g4700 [Phytophthora idaei]|nr:hypothetical protein PI125_g4364 [Phytophthora idaei]KAG3169997.1 hypothetical protein PI126_g2551 [Phytophthora idaei]KAG3250669.1 hypothetical protein PI124_g4700 [Phytophthora idaei]
MLVQIARQYVQQNRRVVWADVARKLSKHQIKKTPKELEMRRRTLKRAHDKDLSKFPQYFSSPQEFVRVPQVPNPTVLGDKQHINYSALYLDLSPRLMLDKGLA